MAASEILMSSYQMNIGLSKCSDPAGIPTPYVFGSLLLALVWWSNDVPMRFLLCPLVLSPGNLS